MSDVARVALRVLQSVDDNVTTIVSFNVRERQLTLHSHYSSNPPRLLKSALALYTFSSAYLDNFNCMANILAVVLAASSSAVDFSPFCTSKRWERLVCQSRSSLFRLAQHDPPCRLPNSTQILLLESWTNTSLIMSNTSEIN